MVRIPEADAAHVNRRTAKSTLQIRQRPDSFCNLNSSTPKNSSTKDVMACPGLLQDSHCWGTAYKVHLPLKFSVSRQIKRISHGILWAYTYNH